MDIIEVLTLVYKFVAEGFAVFFTVAKFPATIYLGVLDKGYFVVASILTITVLVFRRCGSRWKVGGRSENFAL